MASRKQRKRNKAKVQKEREEAKATNVTAVPAQRTNNIEDDDQKQMKKTKNGNKETKSSLVIIQHESISCPTQWLMRSFLPCSPSELRHDKENVQGDAENALRWIQSEMKFLHSPS